MSSSRSRRSAAVRARTGGMKVTRLPRVLTSMYSLAALFLVLAYVQNSSFERINAVTLCVRIALA
eukprot:3017649-Rhodomonas_salina.5